MSLPCAPQGAVQYHYVFDNLKSLNNNNKSFKVQKRLKRKLGAAFSDFDRDTTISQ